MPDYEDLAPLKARSTSQSRRNIRFSVSSTGKTAGKNFAACQLGGVCGYGDIERERTFFKW
jgi:hypothetical protein